jgi:hypothetical protein
MPIENGGEVLKGSQRVSRNSFGYGFYLDFDSGLHKI